MCLIALAHRAHPDWPLLLLANRDEFHAREAAPLAWWTDRPELLAGRDLAEGGTWLGLTRAGRLAAVTNVRGPDAGQRRPRSRGALVTSFLRSPDPATALTDALRADADQVGGYNLLMFDGRELHYASNRPGFAAQAVTPGVHALSNAQLNTPWPKAEAARRAMQDWIARGLSDEGALLDAMRDRAEAQDAQLPQTGVGLEMERMLSPPFIATPTYGTRCTSLVKLARDGTVEFFERRYDAQGAISGETRERFVRDAP